MTGPFRRSVIYAISSTIVFASGGCLSQQRDGDTPQENQNPDEILIDLYSETDSYEEITVKIIRDSTVFEDSFGIPPEEWNSIDPSISTGGQYRVAVNVSGGPSDTASFLIENYDIKEGSNILVTIHEGRIEFSIEE